ncbi:MAG: Tat pathway signal sequence domain protein, partial [Streptomyces sp.]|nr:Tat pathway signal sequence domain protein [Streptomyces sp.]
MSPIPRRSLLKAAAVAGAAAQFSWALGAKDASAAPRAEAADAGPVPLDWLEDGGLGAAPGSTVGVPWPKGVYQADQKFAVTDAGGKAVPVQSWPIAYWPDGSLKWTAHAVSSGDGKLTLAAGETAVPDKKVTVDRSGGTIDVSTGVITAKIGKSGATLVKSVSRGSTEIARNGRLVLIRQPEIEDEDQGAVKTERFEGAISEVTVEQEGPVRAVVRIDGKHRKGSRSWLPFSIRLYFYAGADSFRMVHTITYDGTQEPGKASGDFIRGIGVRFTVPMRDESYDRHIRIGGEGTGLLREAVKGITGLRRDPGAAVQAAQFAGEKLPDPATWDQRVTTRLQYIPEWGDYTLSQLSADGFTLRKRTKKGH